MSKASGRSIVLAKCWSCAGSDNARPDRRETTCRPSLACYDDAEFTRKSMITERLRQLATFHRDRRAPPRSRLRALSP